MEIRKKIDENLKKIYERYGRFVYYTKSSDNFVDKEFEKRITSYLKKNFQIGK